MRLAASLLLLAAPAALRAADPPPRRPLLSARLVHPDREAGRVLDLFRGARAASPADALAAWKRAAPNPKQLGKPLEALLAAINPAMARELGALDGARLAVGGWPGPDPLPWSIRLPHDDGTFAALGSALVLTDGAEEPAIGGVPVDRLGPAGSPLLARGPGGLVIAGTRDDLASRLAGPEPDPAADPAALAWQVDLDPAAAPLPDRGPWAIPARWAAALGVTAHVEAGLDGSSLVVRSRVDRGGVVAGEPGPAIHPGWLDPVPADAAAAGAVALDPGAWHSAFEVVDLAEHSTPGHEDVAPASIRLTFLLRAAGIRDADLTARLRGVSGWAGPAEGGPTLRGAVAGWFDGEDVAARVEAVMARTRPGSVLRRGVAVLVATDPGALAATVAAWDRTGPSAGAALRAGWDGPPPARAGGFWPARWPGLISAGSPLAGAVAEAGPVLWTGRDRGNVRDDQARWSGLDAAVRDFLARIPLDPPPDR